jgi:ABC-type transporter Mla subunit MlaD
MRGIVDRAASHTPSRFTIVAAALGAFAVIGGLTYLAALAPRGVPGYDYYQLNAEFADTGDLRLLSTVSIAGRRVGQVGKLRVDGRKAVMRLQLSPGERFLRSDTTARVRLKNPVGAKYVELTPGTKGRPLRDGDTIPARQTSTAVDYGELLSTFDRRTRRNLQTTLKGLGGGFLGRGQDANDFLSKAPELFGDTNRLSTAILAREGAAARFAPSVESLAGAYDPVREELAHGFEPEARALAPFGDRAGDTQQTLEQAPPALSALRHGLDASSPLLDETAGFARAATRMTKPAPAALRQATSLLREGRPALARTRPLLSAVGRAVNPTVSLLNRFNPIVSPTRRALRRQLRPFREFGGRACDVLDWGTVWRNALSFGVPTDTDPTSELDFGQGIGRLNSFRVLAVPQDDEESLNSDSPQTGTARIGRDPYPAPCQAASEALPTLP